MEFMRWTGMCIIMVGFLEWVRCSAWVGLVGGIDGWDWWVVL